MRNDKKWLCERQRTIAVLLSIHAIAAGNVGCVHQGSVLAPPLTTLPTPNPDGSLDIPVYSQLSCEASWGNARFCGYPLATITAEHGPVKQWQICWAYYTIDVNQGGHNFISTWPTATIAGDPPPARIKSGWIGLNVGGGTFFNQYRGYVRVKNVGLHVLPLDATVAQR